jgi:nucleoside-diphosphate-sugar epimerase
MFASSVTTFALGLPERRMADTDPQNPINLYGVLKVLGEGLGRYYRNRHKIDFRAIRFPSVVGPGNRAPGLATYTTEMIEAAIRGEAYVIQASEDSAIPIIHVADCARALTELSNAPQDRLSRSEYLVDGVKPAPKASELAKILQAAIPTSNVSFAPNPDWQTYLEMYAIPIEDCAARAEWGWKPEYDYRRIVDDFLSV